MSVINQVCKETKLWIHPNLWRPNSYILIHLSSLTFVLQIYGDRYMNLHKNDFVKENKKPLTAIKTTLRD